MSDARIQNFLKNAEAKAQRAIGHTMNVRTSNKTTVTGVVKSVAVNGYRQRARSIVPRYDILLECGINKVERRVTTNTIYL